MKNIKGFTLIELMIAIAIIGILALVLIPRVAGLKDTAREAGLDTNVRMGISVAEALVDDDNATADENGCRWIEGQLDTKLPTDAKNPFTKAVDTQELGTDALAADDSAVYAYTLLAVGAGEENEEANLAAADPLYAGVILFDAYVGADSKLHVKFVPYDAKGAVMASRAKTTN